jgi:hypothetical protein
MVTPPLSWMPSPELTKILANPRYLEIMDTAAKPKAIH